MARNDRVESICMSEKLNRAFATLPAQTKTRWRRALRCMGQGLHYIHFDTSTGVISSGLVCLGLEWLQGLSSGLIN